MRLQEQNFPLNCLIWKRTYSNCSCCLLTPRLFHSFLSAGCLLCFWLCVECFIRVVVKLCAVLHSHLADFLFLSYPALCWTVTVSNHRLCFSSSSQQVRSPRGEYQVLWCTIAPWHIDRAWTGYCFTWSGCAFVGTRRAQWGVDHMPLRPYPTSDSLRGRSLYGTDRQLGTVTPGPLTSQRKCWMGADCPASVQVMHNKVRPRWTHVVSGRRLEVFSAARARDKPTSGSFRGLRLFP